MVRFGRFVSQEKMQLQGRGETTLLSLPIHIMLKMIEIGLTQTGSPVTILSCGWR